jgi:hypothetical protein
VANLRFACFPSFSGFFIQDFWLKAIYCYNLNCGGLKWERTRSYIILKPASGDFYELIEKLNRNSQRFERGAHTSRIRYGGGGGFPLVSVTYTGATLVVAE